MSKIKKETVAQRRARLRKTFPFIVAWNEKCGGTEHFTTQEINNAESTSAPENAIFRNRDGTWSTADEIVNVMMRQIIYVKAMLVAGRTFEIPFKSKEK